MRSMDLKHYMSEHRLDDEQMAALIGGVSAHGVSKWRRGVRIPRPDEMAKIARATKGAVQPNDFYPAADALISAAKKARAA